MAEPISAVDAVAPAFQHTWKQLFQPFRIGVWLRLALLGLLTAEFSGGSSGSRFSVGDEGAGRGAAETLGAVAFETILAGIALLFLGIAVFLVFLYLSAVCRFILFDAVLNDRYRLREGFRRRYAQGLSYFFWQLFLAAVVIGFLAVAIGMPLLAGFAAGSFARDRAPVGLIVLLVAVVLFLVIPFLISIAVVSLGARDFVVPIMAMEKVGIVEGWRRFLPMLRNDFLAYLFYLLLKIVLAIASGILFGILTLIVIVLPLLFFAAMGALMFFAGMFAGLSWNFFTVALAALLVLLLLLVIFALVAFLSVPAVVFFQAYRIHFFGSRYQPVGEALRAGPFDPSPPPEPLPEAA